MPVAMAFHEWERRSAAQERRLVPTEHEEAARMLDAGMERIETFLRRARSRSSADASLTDHTTLMMMPLSVVVFGATGDLARKKLFPALYQLCMLGHFPRDVNIVMYGRTLPADLDAFVERQCVNVVEDPRLSKEDFYKQLRFHAGDYGAPESYVTLDAELSTFEAGQPGNRLFLLSVPPAIFGVVIERLATYTRRERDGGFVRVMIEKPFGRDSLTFEELDATTSKHFKEEQLYRLDHYLGKEVVLNIPTLRWGNQLFEPCWSATFIESVQLLFKEDLGTGGRGGYFDSSGIIRDVMQNHLLQVFMWLAMEPPASLTAADVTAEKVALLRRVRTLDVDSDDVFLAQYTAGNAQPGYLDDPTVPRGSKCPTFASVVLHVDNSRWRGVPFLFTAGKGMDERVCEVRVRFKPQPNNAMMGVESRNELVLRVQPDESIYMVTVAKQPGITAEQVRKPVVMDMSYQKQFEDAYMGDAYERMILNAARGERSLFVSSAELVHAWRIFSKLLHQIENRRPQPVIHQFGLLPYGYTEWAEAQGVTLHPTWQEFVAMNGGLIDEIVRVFAELDVDGSGALDEAEITTLAKRFFDGREPTRERVAAIFRQFDQDGDGKVTLDELVAGAQRMHRAFARFANQRPHHESYDEACEHVHI